MKPRGQAVAGRPWLAVSLVLAGMVHIAAVLAMPRLAQDDAFVRLGRVAPMNQFQALPRPAPGQELIPYNDPAVAEGVCRFDLSEGPLHVRAPLIGDDFVSLSFHGRHDLVFYSLTDKAATRQALDIYVVTAEQLAALQAKDNEEEPPQELRVQAPSRQGFVFARALSPFLSAYDEAARQIAAISCEIEPAAAR